MKLSKSIFLLFIFISFLNANESNIKSLYEISNDSLKQAKDYYEKNENYDVNRLVDLYTSAYTQFEKASSLDIYDKSEELKKIKSFILFEIEKSKEDLANIFFEKENYAKSYEYFLQIKPYKLKKKLAFRLGILYYDGLGVNQNKAQGLTYISKAANGGYIKAKLYMAEVCLNENKNYKCAKNWYLKAAKKGSAEAKSKLKQLDYQLKKDITNYKILATSDDSVAQFELSKLYLQQNEHKKSLYWLEKSANMENLNAISNMIQIYLLGNENIKVDKNKANFWMKKKDEVTLKHHNKVKEALALLEEDSSLSINMLEDEAKIGNKSAIYELTQIYKYGKANIKVNKELMLYWSNIYLNY